ncbi:MAG: hypothetical protein K2Q10_12170, partial [Rhodospirillales bacterium]|nr:hypothetical protein [Rhodospirillales bacterium]
RSTYEDARWFVRRLSKLTPKDIQEIDALLKARGAGDLSRQTLLAEMKRRGLLGDDFSVAAELKALCPTSGGVRQG